MSESEQTPETDTDVFADDLSDDIWAAETSGPGILARMLSEAAGTFILIFMGLGALLFASSSANTLPAAFAFAVGVMIAFVVFSGISGAHINPAVTIGMWVAGRFPGRDVVLYLLGQIVGGIAATTVIVSLVSSLPQVTEVTTTMTNLANGYGDHSPIGMGLVGALILEVLIVAIFVAVFLAVTSLRAQASYAIAPVAIGLAFGFLLIIAIPFTNGALNPAGSTGVALFADSWALQQLWVFWFAAIVGAAITGLLFRAFGPEEDLIIIDEVETIETIETLEVIED